MIRSNKNPSIQNIRKLLNKRTERYEQRKFIIEGVRLLEEAFLSSFHPDLILISQNVSERGRSIVKQLSLDNVKTVEVPHSIINELSDTKAPQGVLAVCSFPQLSLPKQIVFSLVIDGIADPGNLGTILRTALAAGVDSVFILSSTVDPFSPKVVRSAMGAHFKLPIRVLEFLELRSILQADNNKAIKIYLADARGGLPYWDVDLRPPVALVIGSEATGPGNQCREYVENKIWIPMSEKCESLNASIAAGILLFEAARQQRIQRS